MNQKGSLTGWIEALGVDASYRPPARDQPKAVACLFVRRQTPQGKEDRDAQLHRAVYLSTRTAHELVGRLAGKFGFDAGRVVRVVRVVEGRQLEVEVDDEVVREMEEGVGVGLEVLETQGGNNGVKGEWEGMEMDGMVVDGVESGGGGGGRGWVLVMGFGGWMMVMIDDAVGKYMYTMPFGWTALALYFGALSRFFLPFFFLSGPGSFLGGPGASVFSF